MPKDTFASLIPLHFYCDASSHRNHDFMVAGGIALRKSRVDEIEQRLALIKADAGINSEMKWSEYKGGARRHAYEAFVDMAFTLIEERQAAIHTIIANFSDFSHREISGNDYTSVNKMYFQLFLHRLCAFYGKKCGIYIYPDKGDDSKQLPDIRGVLCAHGYKIHKTLPNCVKVIEARHSHLHNMLQMVDIVIGGMAATRNDRSLPQHKTELAAFILERSGHSCWTQNTSYNAKWFTVWNFQHQEISPRRPRL